MGRLLIGLIRLQKIASPVWRALLGGAGPCCRFHPTCSDYAAEALVTHGPWKGAGLAASRLCRCNPWGGTGYDPVPPRIPATIAAGDAGGLRNGQTKP